MMSDVDDDESTLKMLVKLTAGTKLLYQDLQSTAKMRRARRLLNLAQMGLMAERSMEAGQAPLNGQSITENNEARLPSAPSGSQMSVQATAAGQVKYDFPIQMDCHQGNSVAGVLRHPQAPTPSALQSSENAGRPAGPEFQPEKAAQRIRGFDERTGNDDAEPKPDGIKGLESPEPPARRRRNAHRWIAELS